MFSVLFAVVVLRVWRVVKDPSRGPWMRVMPDGSQHAGHTDAYEQIVPINEQIAWTHVFSDGIERDSGDVLLELIEFAIQWRQPTACRRAPSVRQACLPRRPATALSRKPSPRSPPRRRLLRRWCTPDGRLRRSAGGYPRGALCPSRVVDVLGHLGGAGHGV